jgi:hypothetical protein
MPSGLTHILLTKKLQDKIIDEKLKNILAYGSDSLQVGAIAPDIPYASVADNDLFHKQSFLADDFHYKKTNQIPLKSLDLLRKIKGSVDEKNHYQMFSFYMGYISHVFADGIIHPFVRDKVGDYKENASAHRVLEMKLDVLLLRYLTKQTEGEFEINYTEIQDELMNFGEVEGVSIIVETFSKLINDVYGISFIKDEILGWVKGLHRLFDLAAGDFPPLFRNLKFNTFTYKNFADIDPVEVLILQKPEDRDSNFLNVEKLNFFDNCLPQFYSKYTDVVQKAYEFVYKDGPSLSDKDIPMVDLDTGRLVANNNLDEIPVLWINN